MSTPAAHPDFDRLARAMARFVETGRMGPWSGTVYRAASPKYAAVEHFLSGRGAKLKGGRWTPPGGPRTLYAAATPQLALAESLAQASRYGIPARKLLPKLVRAIRVELGQVLDLDDGENRQMLGVSRVRMTTADWLRANARGREALTQAIGRAAAEAGLEAIIVPSAESRTDVNLAIFMDNLRPGSVVELWE